MPRRKLWLVGALLTATPYGTRLADNFLSDDHDLLRWALSTSLVGGLQHPPWTTWLRPITDLLWQATVAVFDTDPLYHHLVNLTLHVTNATLVGALAWRLSASNAASMTAAALFTVHPTAVAAVQWLAGRYDLLSTGLALLALHFAASSSDRRRQGVCVSSVVCAVLAMLAKESAVALPFVAVVLSSPTLARASGALRPLVTRETTRAMLLLVPVYFALRWILFGGLGGYGWHSRLQPVQLLNPFLALPLGVLPWHLDSPLHGFSRLPWLVTCAFSAVAIIWKTPLMACAYGAAFLPIINMMGSGGFLTSEVARLMYFPSVMLSVAVGILVNALWRRQQIVALIGASVLIAMGLTSTSRRLSAWRDASLVTSAVTSTLRSHRPTMALPALIDCTRLPDNIRGAWVYRTGCDSQVRLVLGEDAARGARGADAVLAHGARFESYWCVALNGQSLSPGVCGS